jgi:DEAD/DEAH box helicase domain-containing protein
MPELASLLQTADQIIGFNIKGFDFEVLQPYLNFNIFDVPSLDLLEEIDKVLGHRISLETVAQGTLGSGKSGNESEWCKPTNTRYIAKNGGDSESQSGIL